MLEIACLVYGSMRIKETADNKGYPGVLFILLFIGMWFGGEIFGLIFGIIISGGKADLCIGYICAVLGALAGGGTAFLIVAILPEREGNRRWDHLGRPIVPGGYDCSRPRRRRRPRDLDIDDDYKDKFSDRPRRRPIEPD